jgi:hypothetical protein
METNCCKILRKELSPCQDYFSSDDATGLTIDIGESFGPSSVWAILAKVALAGFTIFTWVSMFLASDYKGFFFAYLTIWTLTLQVGNGTTIPHTCFPTVTRHHFPVALSFTAIFACPSNSTPHQIITFVISFEQLVYHVFSVWLSLSPPPGINTRVKIAWYFFNMVSNTGILVALLWWGTVYDPDENLTFNLVAPHSATVVVCLVDGLVVNRIPVRLFHWYVVVVALRQPNCGRDAPA